MDRQTSEEEKGLKAQFCGNFNKDKSDHIFLINS